jgi:hypothetical protein
MSTRTRNRLGIALGLALAAVMGTGAVSTVKAGTETNEYSFCSQTSCTDGYNAAFPLLRQGNKYYGTTDGGGANGSGGVVFRYNANNGNYAVLYSFCATMSGSTCTDGAEPAGPLIMDTNGNLYGTTQEGGTHNGGTVFELVKPASGPWTLTTLYDFCASTSGGLCLDGKRPVQGLSYVGNGTSMYDGTSILYGTTYQGGNDSNSTTGWGTAFEIEPPVSGTLWQQKVIHSFCASCSTTGSNFPNGFFPDGSFVVDGSGNIWGTTAAGGTNVNGGVAFELTPGADPWVNTWTDTTLYNFCWANGTKCPDGESPNGVVMDSSGHLFGTTFEGGGGYPGFGGGILFKLSNGSCTEGGTATFWCETVLHSFCPTMGCSDGEFPTYAPLMDGSGNLYGTNSQGGNANNGGNVWDYNTGTSSFSTVYNFCPGGGSCTDGDFPDTGLIFDNAGDLWSVTGSGGAANDGVIFEVVP